MRVAARGLAERLRARRHSASVLLARTAALLVQHGLANGALDGLRERFRQTRGENVRLDQNLGYWSGGSGTPEESSDLHTDGAGKLVGVPGDARERKREVSE